MTEQEYEGNYQDAIRQIKQRGVPIGEPYVSHDGVRGVHIRDFPCGDHLVFKEAWGEVIATAMMRESGRWPIVPQPIIDPEKFQKATEWMRLIVKRASSEFADFTIDQGDRGYYTFDLNIRNTDKSFGLTREEIEAVADGDEGLQRSLADALTNLARRNE